MHYLQEIVLAEHYHLTGKLVRLFLFINLNTHIVANCRPISFTGTCYKTLEYILSTRIMTFLEENHILYQEQQGFQKGSSALSGLVGIAHDLFSKIGSSGQTDFIFQVSSKAFDSVSHEKLVTKIKHVFSNVQVLT